MKMEFTTNEKMLRGLILNIENSINPFSAKRDKELLIILQIILTLSLDGQIEELLKIISKKFPEYGSLTI